MIIDKDGWELFLYEKITDEMLTTPVRDLNDVEVELLRRGFSGPYGPKLIDRLDNLNSA